MSPEKLALLEKIQPYVIESRRDEIDEDYLHQEVVMLLIDDLHRISAALYNNLTFDQNPHNSILLYITGLTNSFDFAKGRSDTIGGAPPD